MSRAEERALEAYPHYTAENLDDVIKARKFFAKGYEQAEKDLNKKPSEDLEEAAKEYADKHGFRVPYDGSNNYYDDVDVKASKEGFLAGAEWGAKQNKKQIQDAYERGKQEGMRIIRSWESSPGQCGY